MKSEIFDFKFHIRAEQNPAIGWRRNDVEIHLGTVKVVVVASSNLQIIISILTLLGVGGIAGGYITYLLDKKKERGFKVLEQKEKRYKSCLLYMDAFFEPKNIKYLSSRQPDIDDAKDIIAYLQMEYHEMILYASKEVIISVKTFIEDPSRENFLNTILIMRRDLSAKRNDLDLEKIKLNLKSKS